MNHNSPPFERQCYCPFSFPSLGSRKEGKKKRERTVQKMADKRNLLKKYLQINKANLFKRSISKFNQN